MANVTKAELQLKITALNRQIAKKDAEINSLNETVNHFVGRNVKLKKTNNVLGVLLFVLCILSFMLLMHTI